MQDEVKVTKKGILRIKTQLDDKIIKMRMRKHLGGWVIQRIIKENGKVTISERKLA